MFLCAFMPLLWVIFHSEKMRWHAICVFKNVTIRLNNDILSGIMWVYTLPNLKSEIQVFKSFEESKSCKHYNLDLASLGISEIVNLEYLI
jgi:hypothetical protein